MQSISDVSNDDVTKNFQNRERRVGVGTKKPVGMFEIPE